MALSTAQMGRMSRLLDEVLDLDEAGRRRWLESLDEQHRDLQDALRSALLPREGLAAATLPKMPAEPEAVTEPALQPGTRVGPYELVRHLGHGGMAEVWLARRADGAYEREVALKLPAAAQLRGDVHQRFIRERDILAGLEHPGIARFYDAGIDSGGMPYFAMEFVAGKTLTVWCDEARLGIRSRLELFLQVLEAVQYAHDHGVLHRDIKPSNVLATEPGQVRLLDFGVARMLGRRDAHLTVEYGRALTPEFASPEQLASADLGPASDVYSLGVLLCELLCGHLPYRLEGGWIPGEIPAASRPSLQLIAAQAAAARASSPRKLRRHLRGDLDAIVLKALAREVHDRYPTAQALADDLRRYLSGLPVEARPGQLAYRAGKFLLRHRASVAVVAAAVMLVLASIEFGYPRSSTPLIATAPPPAARALPLQTVPQDKSIAVLPFADMSENHDQEYFSDGLSEELIDRLSHSPDLRVVSRTSSFYFKGKQATVPEIAGILHVSYVLAGSVRKAGTVLRIGVQLIRASDGFELWSHTYERPFADIFRTQEDIAQTTAQALKVALAPNAPALRATGGNTESYTLLLQGNFFSDRFSKADSYRAIEFYQRAIGLEPNYALAWAKLSEVYWRQVTFNWSSILPTSSKAKEAAEHALELDPELSIPHWALGALATYVYWDWKEARSHLERASELNPNDVRAARTLALINGGLYGRMDTAIEIGRERISLDPLDTVAINISTVDLFLAERYPEAVASARQLLLLNPSYAATHSLLALSLMHLGRLEEALAAAQMEADESFRLWALPMVYWTLGRRSESDAALRRLETKYGDLAPYAIVEVHAYRGELDDAFRWLDRAYRTHDPGMPQVRIDPLLRNLRQDRRFQAVLANMKLDGAAPQHGDATASVPFGGADKSIAVLPFVDMSEKHDQEYFSDGLTEELIERLSHSPDLRVVSRTSSFYFKGRQATIPEIASTLHVSYVLAGSVRKAGTALRIAVQLISASDGSERWSHMYERRFADIFKTQEDIASATAQALKVALAPDSGTRGQETNPAAYTLLLQGNYFSDRVSQADSHRAIELYKRALALDPDYAMAWAKLSEVYWRQAMYGWGNILSSAGRARNAAQHALRLDPDLALAHLDLGALATWVYWNWGEAESQLKRAHELDPDDMRVANYLAWIRGGMYGRLDEAINIARTRAEREPLYRSALNLLTFELFLAGRYPEVVIWTRQLLLVNPLQAEVHAYQAYALVYLGRPQEALAAAQGETDAVSKMAALSIVYWALGRKADSTASLRELETKYADTVPYSIAAAHASRGEIDDAFRWLDRAYRRHDTAMSEVGVDPLLQNLRGDRRYQALLVKMNLDAEPAHRQ
jgi:TolB-like protein/Flp pilus assembly protein TadD